MLEFAVGTGRDRIALFYAKRFFSALLISHYSNRQYCDHPSCSDDFSYSRHYSVRPINMARSRYSQT